MQVRHNHLQLCSKTPNGAPKDAVQILRGAGKLRGITLGGDLQRFVIIVRLRIHWTAFEHLL